MNCHFIQNEPLCQLICSCCLITFQCKDCRNFFFFFFHPTKQNGATMHNMRWWSVVEQSLLLWQLFPLWRLHCPTVFHFDGYRCRLLHPWVSGSWFAFSWWVSMEMLKYFLIALARMNATFPLFQSVGSFLFDERLEIAFQEELFWEHLWMCLFVMSMIKISLFHRLFHFSFPSSNRCTFSKNSPTY